MGLKDYRLVDILPVNGDLASVNADQGDMLVCLAASAGWIGEKIATKGQIQFELLPGGIGNILVRHDTHGLVGVYFDNSLGVRWDWARNGLGVALILYGYDHGKTPSADRQFTIAGAKAMTKAMRVANGSDMNPYWP